MFKWDMECFEFNLKYIDILLLGVVVFVGMIFLIDWEYSVKLLGFSEVYYNSLDVVFDWDFVFEFFSNVLILMMYFLWFCEEIVSWSSYEFKYISLSDQFLMGSLIML